jgi:peptide/nickel transport system substrate-binding protein
MEIGFLANMYETLIRANPPGSAEPYSPLLATEWTVSKDGLKWTFKLRQGVKFHDGTSFNADAVKYSIERTKRLALGAAYMWDVVKAVKVLGTYSVEFDLTSAVALEPMLASGYAAWMISPASKAKGDKWFNDGSGHDDGTGPYTLVSYQPKEQAVFKKFDAYWGGWKPNQYDTVVYKFTSDPQTEMQMLQSGDVDVAMTLPKDIAQQMKSDTNLNVVGTPGMENVFIYLNCQKKPLDNVLVRQALSYATPYNDIIQLAENGEATPAHGPVPTSLWPGDPSLPAYSYDLAKARQLLAQAGYPGGGFKLLMTTNSNRTFETQAGVLIKESYKKVGVDVTLRPMPWNQTWALAKGTAANRQDMLAMYWWPSYPDGYDSLATAFVTEKSPGYNLNYWYNKSFDALINKAHTISGADPQAGKDMFMQAQKMLIDNAVALYLYDCKDVIASVKSVKGVTLSLYYPQTFFWYDVTPS